MNLNIANSNKFYNVNNNNTASNNYYNKKINNI